MIVCELLAKRFGQVREVLGYAEAHFPGAVLAGGEQGRYRVLLVFFVVQVLGDGDEGFKGEDSDGILLVYGQLVEDLDKIVQNVLLLDLNGKLANLRRTCFPYQWRVILTQLQKLLPQLILMRPCPLVAALEKIAGALSLGEAVARGEV